MCIGVFVKYMEMDIKQNTVRIMYGKEDIDINFIEYFGYIKSQTTITKLPNHFHKDTIEICFILKGNQHFYIGKDEYDVNGNTIFITLPNEVHSSGRYPVDRNEFYWLGVNVSTIDNFKQIPRELRKSFFEQLKNINVHTMKLTKEMTFLVKKAFSFMESKMGPKDPAIVIAALGYIISLLTEISSLSKSVDTQISDEIQKAIQFVDSNLESNISLDMLAKVSGFSLSHFKYKFKQETGNTPTNYILQRKIKYAKELLSMPSASITQVAYQLEFSSCSYFTLMFKQITAMTPSQYIKSLNSTSE